MTRSGAVAEWLGRGLQSLVQRFESARRLFSNGLEPGFPGEVFDPLHQRLALHCAPVPLSRLDLRDTEARSRAGRMPLGSSKNALIIGSTSSGLRRVR